MKKTDKTTAHPAIGNPVTEGELTVHDEHTINRTNNTASQLGIIQNIQHQYVL